MSRVTTLTVLDKLRLDFFCKSSQGKMLEKLSYVKKSFARVNCIDINILDWVDPIINRPSTDELHNFVKKKILFFLF